MSCPPWTGLLVLPLAAPLAGNGEGADREALLVLLYPGPARLGADLLPAPHPEAGAEKMWLAGCWYRDPSTESLRGSGLNPPKQGTGSRGASPPGLGYGTHITALCGHSGLVG